MSLCPNSKRASRSHASARMNACRCSAAMDESFNIHSPCAAWLIVGGLSQDASVQRPKITRNSTQIMLLLPGQSSPPSKPWWDFTVPPPPPPLSRIRSRNSGGGGECPNARAAGEQALHAAGIKRPERRPLPAFSDRSSVCRSVDRWVKCGSVGLRFKETTSITLFHRRTLPILCH